jgi:Domain of unknown function (DUF4836)
MKAFRKTILCGAASLLFLISCKNTSNLNDSMTAIPKDATSVTAINIQNLMQKADFESVKNMDFYKEILSEAEQKNPAMSEILKDPKKSGIDLAKNMYIVQDIDLISGAGAGNNSVVLMSIADSKAFEAMLQNAKAGEVKTKEGVKYISMKKEGEVTDDNGYKINYNSDGLVAWNDKMAVLGSHLTENTEGVADDSFLKYFKTKPEESITQNENMRSLMGSNHDMYTFASFDKYADNIQAKAAAGAMNIDPKALKGNYFTGYSDFEKGQIVSKSDFKINKDITKDWGLLFKNNVKTDFSKYLNGQNLGFVLTLGLDMKGLKEIINANPQFRMATKMGEGTYNFSIDDLCKALDGDVVITASPTDKKDKWSGMMGFKVSDKPSVQKLLDVLVKEEIILKENENTYRFAEFAENMAKTYVNESKIQFVDDVLFVGDNATVSNLNGKGSVNGDIKDVLNKNIFGMYANFNKLLMFSEDMKDPEFSEMKMMIGSKTGEGVLKMKDTNENSLKSLMKSVNKMYLKNKENKAKMKEDTKDTNVKESI